MTFRIQKTIISKFLELVDQDATNESQITELVTVIENLYKNRVLFTSDIYRHKLEIILHSLYAHLGAVKRKRINKEVKVQLNNDIHQILKNDLEGVDYSKTELTDLDKFENEKEMSITSDNVRLVLENLVIPKRRLGAEADFEKFVTDQLVLVFGKDRVHRQYSVGGFLALKTDIDIGNGQVGIEIKIADRLSATDMQRMIGQVVYYKKRFYNNNLLVYMASRTSVSPTTKELMDFIRELGTTIIFMRAVNL